MPFFYFPCPSVANYTRRVSGLAHQEAPSWGILANRWTFLFDVLFWSWCTSFIIVIRLQWTRNCTWRVRKNLHICRKKFFVKLLWIATRTRDPSNFQPSSGAAACCCCDTVGCCCFLIVLAQAACHGRASWSAKIATTAALTHVFIYKSMTQPLFSSQTLPIFLV